MNFQTMSKQRKMILIAAAVGLIAVFLPWWSISLGVFGGGSVNGMHNEGIIVFLAFLAAVVLSVVGDQSKNLDQTNWMLTLIAGGLAAIISLITFVNAPPIGDRGIGLYLSLIAAIGVVALAYINRGSGETLQGGFDTLKSRFGKHSETAPADRGSASPMIHSTNDPSKPVV